jgi:hypothetical protein
MKRSLLIVTLLLAFSQIYGQKSIDAMFNKYAGKDGFVTVTVSGDLLKFASCFDEEHNHDRSLPANITEIRILAQKSRDMQQDNFHAMTLQGLNLNDYDEFMRIKDYDQDIRMLVRSKGNKLREFLVIAGGEDNAIIQIKGEMTFKEARKFSKELEKNGGLNIDMDYR